jgi:hypothetical protein
MYDLLQVMQQDGYLSSGELIALRKTCKELGENPVRILRSLNIASPEQIQEYLQRYFRVNALGNQAISKLDESYQAYVPIDLAIHYSCFGLGEENSALYIAMEDPSDRGAIQQLRFFLNKRIIVIAATVYQLAEGLSRIYRVSIPNLKLTTVIERSRGVIGGLRYEIPIESQSFSVNNNVAGNNLSPNMTEEVENFAESSMPKTTKKTKQPRNNSNEEPSAEISAPDLNTPDLFNTPSVEPLEDTMISEVDSSTGLLADDMSPDNVSQDDIFASTPQTFDETSISQISALASSALVKVSMMYDKSQAIVLLNNLLDPYQISVSLLDDASYQIVGQDFSVQGNLTSRVSNNQNPIAYAIDPILKLVLKMKESS